jgi:hypothetical protein
VHSLVPCVLLLGRGRCKGVGPYAHEIKKLEDDIKATLKKVNEKMGRPQPPFPIRLSGAHIHAGHHA